MILDRSRITIIHSLVFHSTFGKCEVGIFFSDFFFTNKQCYTSRMEISAKKTRGVLMKNVYLSALVLEIKYKYKCEKKI